MTEGPVLHGAVAATKLRAEMPSESLGEKPVMDWLPLDKLFMDHRYQRELGRTNHSHINRILRDFRWLYCQPLVVTPTGTGMYAVIDGQHRLEAARKHPAIDRLPCYIVRADTVAEQARAFEALNGKRIGITRIQRFWAAHAAGEPVACRIASICERAGIKITRVGGDMPPRTTMATYTIEKLLRYGDDKIVAGLTALAEGQRDTFNGMRAAAVHAAIVIAANTPGFKREVLRDMFQSLDLLDAIVVANAKRASAGGTLEHTLTLALAEMYQRRAAFAGGRR